MEKMTLEQSFFLGKPENDRPKDLIQGSFTIYIYIALILDKKILSLPGLKIVKNGIFLRLPPLIRVSLSGDYLCLCVLSLFLNTREFILKIDDFIVNSLLAL